MVKLAICAGAVFRESEFFPSCYTWPQQKAKGARSGGHKHYRHHHNHHQPPQLQHQRNRVSITTTNNIELAASGDSRRGMHRERQALRDPGREPYGPARRTKVAPERALMESHRSPPLLVPPNLRIVRRIAPKSPSAALSPLAGVILRAETAAGFFRLAADGRSSRDSLLVESLSVRRYAWYDEHRPGQEPLLPLLQHEALFLHPALPRKSTSRTS